MKPLKALIVLNLVHGSFRPLSITFCQDAYKIANNIVDYSKGFDYCYFVNNNYSIYQDKFKYLPPINTSDIDTARMTYLEDKILTKKRVLNKRNFGLSEQLQFELIDFQEVSLVGFTATLDVLPFCLNLIDFHPKVSIKEDCVGDISLEHKTRSLDYLRFIGVPIL